MSSRIETLKATLLLHATDLVASLLPVGRRESREWVALNPTRADSSLGSLKVNLDTGKWADFATDEHGDLIDLYRYVTGCTPSVAIRELEAKYMGRAAVPKELPSARTSVFANENWVPIVPIPEGVPQPDFIYKRNLKPDCIYKFRSASGELIGFTCRFNKENGEKDVLPYTYCRNKVTGEESWRWKSWQKPLPLFQLHRLHEHPRVIVVEGEKTALAASVLFPKHAVVTWVGGDKNVFKADWSPLAGRIVFVCPDADDVGQKAAEEIAKRLAPLEAVVHIVAPPRGVAKGWDLADGLAEGWTPADADAWLFTNSELVAPAPPKKEPNVLVPQNKEQALTLSADEDDDKKKPSDAELFDKLGALVDGRPGSGITASFPVDFRVMREYPKGIDTILEVNAKDGTVERVLPNRVAQVCADFTRQAKLRRFRVTAQKAKEFVENWLCWTTKTIDTKPKSIAFKSDPQLCYHRLSFDPVHAENLDKCTTWRLFQERMSNFDAFCMWLARLFKEGAPRTQTLYLQGDGGSGKSTIDALLMKILGGDLPHKGAHLPASTEDFTKEKHFMPTLVGKRLCVIDEPDPKFLLSRAYKKVTGNASHLVNQKNRDIYAAQLDFRIMFTSNDPPEVTSQKAHMRRVILCQLPGALNTPDFVEKRLIQEFPMILGYGEHLLKKLGLWDSPHDIPADTEELEALAEDQEHLPQQIWSDNFEEQTDPEQCVVCSDVISILKEKYGVHCTTRQHEILGVWKRKYGIKRDRRSPKSTGVRIWLGMGFKKRYHSFPSKSRRYNTDTPSKPVQ